MNQEQIFGVIRHVFTAVGGIVIAQGYISDSMYTELSGAVLTLVGVIWSIVTKKPVVK
jgi:hypothetical protein